MINCGIVRKDYFWDFKIELCVNAREKVVREFDSEVVAGKYMELYEEILQK